MSFKKTVPIVALSIIGMYVLDCVAQDQKPDVKVDASKNLAVKALQIERRNVLKDRLDAVRKEFKGGRGNIVFVVDAEKDFLNAELDVVSNKEARIQIRQKLVAGLAEVERFAKLNWEGGTGTVQDVLAARAAWLEARIELLKEMGD